MKKEILLSIAGLHMIEEEDGNVEVVTAGDYYNRNGKHYVVYDEVVEGLSGHISNTIKIGGQFPGGYEAGTDEYPDDI